MRLPFILLSMLACTTSACAQTGKLTSPVTSSDVKQQISQLLAQLNEAAKKHDRPVLEKIYADEFQFIHGSGFIDNKAEHIQGIMETDSVNGIRLPSLDNLLVFDNMAIYRNPFRGPAGNLFIGTTIYAKRNGNWQIIQIQGTPQLPERKWIKSHPAMLESCSGTYQQANGVTINISRAGDTLVVRSKTLPPRRYLATAENQFFDKFGVLLSFQKENERVVRCTMRYPSGMESKWMKKEE